MDAAAPELAALRARLADLEAQVDELRAALDAGRARGGVQAPPPGPMPAWDEIEPDSRVLDGSTPTGGSKRREDKSLEWAAGEIAVLRLFAWADNTLRTKTIGPEESSSSSGSSSDGVRFLARVPKNPKDPSQGAKLEYFKLYAEGGCPPAYSLKEESASCGTKITLKRKECDESGSGSSVGSFRIPPVPSMSIGDVSSGSSADASIRDGSRCGSFVLDLVLPKGDPGDPGAPGASATGSFTVSDGERFDSSTGELQWHEQPYHFVNGVATKNGAGTWKKLMDTTDCS